ncbi:hypothetical protein SISSUDRAFT_359334 [Sistotremastrum suecicum HHB10207 ss-3]|uniref:Uncharacterized protein n=1 Tax=Sistotremastrum suecicum HHB10207 ss-3 TaxID=1314776 RepID=A0A165Z7C5_9AGAM|nr:hypothetical protein SISSUDRAFT_359334 [Sistotremastrum suecicum HHB10207 ss-3]
MRRTRLCNLESAYDAKGGFSWGHLVQRKMTVNETNEKANSIPSRLSRPDRERGRKTPLYDIYCLSWETIIPGDRSYASSSHKNLRIGPQASASAYATTSHKTMQFGKVKALLVRKGALEDPTIFKLQHY